MQNCCFSPLAIFANYRNYTAKNITQSFALHCSFLSRCKIRHYCSPKSHTHKKKSDNIKGKLPSLSLLFVFLATTPPFLFFYSSHRLNEISEWLAGWIHMDGWQTCRLYWAIRADLFVHCETMWDTCHDNWSWAWYLSCVLTYESEALESLGRNFSSLALKLRIQCFSSACVRFV